jgi:hypothetical protein
MLAPELRRKGCSVVAVISRREVLDLFATSYDPDAFDAVLHFDGDLAGLSARLERYQPSFVIPGTESGVELADQLAALVTPSLANDPALIAARTNKFHMVERVRSQGLAVIRSVCSSDASQIERWIDDNQLHDRYIVLKPPASAGTDAVTKMLGRGPWRSVFDQMLGQKNRLGRSNDAILAQEFIDGDEYVFDTFSHDGHHTLTNLCKYKKVQNQGFIAVYDRMDFLPYDHGAHGQTRAYVHAVLDALGIRNGPAHTEVIIGADGPRLVETGARMHGGGHPRYCRLCTSDSQLDRLVGYYTERIRPRDGFELQRRLAVVFLITRASGRLRNPELLARIPELPSCYELHCSYVPGSHAPMTRDLFSLLGFAVLCHHDQAQIERDYQTIKRIEADLEYIDTPLNSAAVPALSR